MPEKLKEGIIEDCSMTLPEALEGKNISLERRETLVVIDIVHLSFDGKLHKGQMVVHIDLEEELLEIFAELLKLEFPINKIIPITKYDWSDVESMKDNNSSSFNDQNIAGTDRPSVHAEGRAVDINPFQNPCIENGLTEPEGAEYNLEAEGTLTPEIIKVFTSRGWTWGGNWNTLKDYHHFEKKE